MSFEEQLKEIKNPSIIKIAEYLKSRNDVNLDKQNKNLDEMWKYIQEEARKQATNNCACIEDEVVFGWAVHYYDEDELVIESSPKEKQEPKQEIIRHKEEPPKEKKSKKDPMEGQVSLF